MQDERGPLGGAGRELRRDQVIQVRDRSNLGPAIGVEMSKKVGRRRSCHEHLASMQPTVWGSP